MRNSCGHGPRRKERVRCAIYTRKSCEEGLEQQFNSLQAQREACEAFINSQRHEGWVSLPKAYDDSGFSGATMDRPALQRLLADITAGRVDTIVVYKIDRLTRSLADFAKIVEILDARGASFVSVTQQFNTTTSMGRLTLNVLLSFAQFEREVIGERIRDKIAASKQKGMWMGGIPPLGYRVHDRKLVVIESEAEIVRIIFRRYAELGSVRLLKDEFEARGLKSKSWTTASGRRVGGKPFSRGALYLVQRFQNINMLWMIFLFRRDVVRGGVEDWTGGSNGSTSSSDCAADRCGAAATFGGDFSVSDGAHEPCRTGADYTGLFGGAVGLRSGAHDWGDAADSDTLPGASGRTGGDRGTG